ncbi:unnamed protein product [Prunus armeniaca]
MAEAFKIRLLQSTPYYAKANGQAESSNKVIINIIRKILEKNPNQWHEKLSETLWAYRTSKREATGMTRYALSYGHDAILPMEIAVQSLIIAHQHNLVGENYSEAMLLELEGLDASRIDTLNKLLAGKQAVVHPFCVYSYDGRAKFPTALRTINWSTSQLSLVCERATASKISSRLSLEWITCVPSY